MRMPAIEPGSQAWEACKADAATLHAPRQVYPCLCTLTGSGLNDIKIIVHDYGELQMHLLRQSEYGARKDSRMPRTPDTFPAQAMRPDGDKDADVRRSCLGEDKLNVGTFTFALQPGVSHHGPRSSANSFRFAGQHTKFAPRMRLHAGGHKMLPISIGLVV